VVDLRRHGHIAVQRVEAHIAAGLVRQQVGRAALAAQLAVLGAMHRNAFEVCNRLGRRCLGFGSLWRRCTKNIIDIAGGILKLNVGR
jgi:hypothetical protein